jgi:hypothetical protein
MTMMKAWRNGRACGMSLYRIEQMITIICCVIFGWVPDVLAQQQLENPQPDSFQSGIVVISGWVCNAQKVQIRIDNQIFLDTVYGTGREDTRGQCRDTNNGFNVLVNWNELNEGVHTVALCVDNACGNNIRVDVTSYGLRFLRGLDGTAIAACTNKLSPAFPTPTVFTWQESLQNWTIGLTPTCGEVDEECFPLPLDSAERTICLDLIDCCSL